MMLTGNVLPFHSPPLPDELLSSWLVRLARGNGQKLHTFCDVILEKKPIWNRDIDKSADNKVLKILSDSTGITYSCSKNTVLNKYEGRLFEKLISLGNTNWILPVGIYHRKHKDFGLQYCPLCLKEDEIPYFRTLWRVGLIPVCIQHSCCLRDCCPICQSPVMFYRSDFQDRERVAYNPVWMCSTCNADLRRGTVNKIDSYTLRFYSHLHTCLKRGWLNIGDYKQVYSFLYFNGIRHLVKLIAIQKRYQCVVERFSGQVIPRKQEYNFVELLRCEGRMLALKSISGLLQNWPHRFINRAQCSKLTASALMFGIESMPYWYQHPIYTHIENRVRKISHDELVAAYRHLSKTSEFVTFHDFSRILGFYDSPIARNFLLAARRGEI